MSLSTFVKVGNVNNLSDARYCAGMEVNLVGFPMDGSAGITAETFNEMSSWLSGVEYVGEFINTPLEGIAEILEQCNFSYIQTDDISLIGSLPDLPVILESNVQELEEVPDNLPIAYLVVSGNAEGTLSNDNLAQLERLSGSYKILLGAGIRPDSINTMLKELPVHGISMKGTDEIRPGYKDYDELADILELLEVES